MPPSVSQTSGSSQIEPETSHSGCKISRITCSFESRFSIRDLDKGRRSKPKTKLPMFDLKDRRNYRYFPSILQIENRDSWVRSSRPLSRSRIENRDSNPDSRSFTAPVGRLRAYLGRRRAPSEVGGTGHISSGYLQHEQ